MLTKNLSGSVNPVRDEGHSVFDNFDFSLTKLCLSICVSGLCISEHRDVFLKLILSLLSEKAPFMVKFHVFYHETPYKLMSLET